MSENMNHYVIDRMDERFSFYPNDSQCMCCGGDDFVYSAFVNSGQKLMVQRHCLNCGHNDYVKKVRMGTKERGVNQQNKWSQAVRKRDGNKCVICKTSNGLHAHHIIPVSKDKNNKYVFDVNNGITLCKEHHTMAHGEWMRKINNTKATVDFNVVDIARQELQDIIDKDCIALRSPFEHVDFVDVDYDAKSNKIYVKMVYTEKRFLMDSMLMERKCKMIIHKLLEERMMKYIGDCLVDISVANLFVSKEETQSERISEAAQEAYDVFGRTKEV